MDCRVLKKRGFSLIEISLALLLCGILLLMILIAGKGVIANSNLRKSQIELNTIAQACRVYYQNQGHWPSQVSDLQPLFLSPRIDSQNYTLDQQSSLLKISSAGDTITVLKPQGLTGRLDYYR